MTYKSFYRIVNDFYRFVKNNKTEYISLDILHEFIDKEDICLDTDVVRLLLFATRKHNPTPEVAEFLIKRLIDLLISNRTFLDDFDGYSIRRIIRRYDQKFNDEICKYIIDQINKEYKVELSSKFFKKSLVDKFRMLKNKKYATIAALL